jgi:hypothetical protein
MIYWKNVTSLSHMQYTGRKKQYRHGQTTCTYNYVTKCLDLLSANSFFTYHTTLTHHKKPLKNAYKRNEFSVALKHTTLGKHSLVPCKWLTLVRCSRRGQTLRRERGRTGHSRGTCTDRSPTTRTAGPSQPQPTHAQRRSLVPTMQHTFRTSPAPKARRIVRAFIIHVAI